MFRYRFREMRERAGYLSQQSFADAFGIAQSTVGGWEAGRREPPFDTLVRIADFLGCTTDYLLGSGGTILRLKEVRKQNGISQKTLAEKLNVAQNTISNWENGIREPSLEMLVKLADVLGCTADYLLGRSTPEKEPCVSLSKEAIQVAVNAAQKAIEDFYKTN